MQWLVTSGEGAEAEMEPSAVDTLISTIPVTGISVGTLVMLMLTAFFKEWIYTRGHVVAERTRHAQEVKDLREDHARQMTELREGFNEQIRILREDRDSRIAEYQTEVSDWREAYRGMEMALAAVRAQNGELLELARTSEHVLRSWPVAVEKTATHD